jgi:iron complex outermembrane receptor protein
VRHQIAAGGDFRIIDGESRDSYFNPSATFVDDRKISSGRQNFYGLFVEDLYQPTGKLEIDISIRGDLFQNLSGKIVDTASVLPSTAAFPDHSRTAISPRIGLRYDPLKWLTFRGGIYGAFRAPTLAELYRQTSVERLVLHPNPNLAPEFLRGGEVGLDFRRLPGLTLGLTAYWDIVHKTVSNIVTATDPVRGEDRERTRVNLGRVQTRGYQLKFEYEPYWITWGRWSRYNPHIVFSASFLESEAKLVHNPLDPTLEGRRLALVPWQTLDVDLRYSDSMLGEALLQVVYQGKQWEDADNHDLQPGYWLANLTIAKKVSRVKFAEWLNGSTLYLKLQNVFDRSYIVDIGGGIPKLGTPLLVQGGIMVPVRF